MTTSTPIERRRLPTRRALLCVSTILAAGFAMPATAQLAAPAPVRQNVDANGVDLFTGTMNVDAPALAIGGAQGLSYRKLNRGAGWTDDYTAVINLSGSTIMVSIGGTSDSFTVSNGTYTPTEGNGAALSFDSAANVYTYTSSDGTRVRFARYYSGGPPYFANQGRVIDLTRPSGDKLTYSYDTLTYCTSNKAGATTNTCIVHTNTYRIGSIQSSFGYKLVFAYDPIAEFDPNDASTPPDLQTWSTVTGVGVRNLAVSPSTTLTSQRFANGNVTDADGQTTSYRTGGSGEVLGITRPGSGSEDVTVGYNTSGRVTSVANHTGKVDYAVSDTNSERTVTVTDPLKHTSIYVFDIASRRVKTMTDALSRKTSLTYDASGRVMRITRPENDYTQITYDTRGNVTEQRSVAKTGPGADDIVTSASYPATCASAVTCNQPTSTTDANLAVTDYTYDPTNGGVSSVTSPAPTANTARPKTSYTYGQFQAYYDNGSGSITASGQPVYRLTDSSTCPTSATCDNTRNLITTHIDYGPQTASVGNNLLPVSTSGGDGTLVATVATAYDAIGNVASVDGPLPGADDTTTYRYDAARRLVGTISADPDGAGALKRRAVKTGYNGNSQPVLTELGTVNGTSDNDWSAFVSLQQSAASYDTDARKVSDVVTAGGNTYGVSQYSYDAAGRPACSAVRMNTATWKASPATDACTLQAAGSAGPDRITAATYDNAGQLTKTTSGYGTTDVADDATGTYTDNGRLATLADAKGNLTTYEYDGFDRLSKTRYPDTSVGAGTSSTSDYEQLSYDKAGNVLSRRLRDASSTGYAYDALSRVVTKTLPNGEAAVTYSYDLLSRPIGASTSGQALTFTYDALGRNLTQGGPLGTVTAQYDLAGRRTQLVWPDQFYVLYDYLTTGEMTAIREKDAALGSAPLATFGYDDLGRRTKLTRGNGTSASYKTDAVSRLDTLTQTLPNSADSVTATFTYNPSSQIASTTRSNDAYAWRGAANRNTPYTINGLNQATAAGTSAIGYDARGNTMAIGASAYTYSAENLLLTGPSSASLAYDPLARLYQTTGTATTRFLYDGSDMIGEYGTNNALQRRYVFGPGSDEPLVWYEGSGSADKRWLQADERGSIIAVTNAAGAKLATNAYDEYGVPATGNLGRFGYTGQTWLPELGMWYYKARMYAPSLGRFMQTDPIGYGDGPNWYGYVGGDPANGSDPSGQKTKTPVKSPQTPPQPPQNPGGSEPPIVVTAIITRLPPGSIQGAGRGPANQPVNREGGAPQKVPPMDIGIAEPSNVDIVVVGTLTGLAEAAAAEDIIVTASRGLFSRLIGRLFRRSACFSAGTLVQTDHGLRAIETIKPGEMVLSRDERTGRTAYKRVTAVKMPTQDELYTIQLDVPAEKTAEHHADFQATATHPWRTADGHWIATTQLRRGMKLVRAEGSPAQVEQVRDSGHKAATYNLTVEGYHTYFVGQDHLWVHNACDERPNVVQNRQAADARQQAERLTGRRFSKPQQREFHDRITGEGLGYDDLVDEAVRVLTGK